MKKLAIILFLLFIPFVASADQISWDFQNTYENGLAIPTADQANIIFHLFVDGSEFATVTGAREWNGTLPQLPGESKGYSATAELYGQTSEMSPVFKFDYPAIPPSAPSNIIIHITIEGTLSGTLKVE